MTTVLAIAALVVIVAGATVLICAAHIPGLRTITGAAPLEAEPLPLDADPEQHADMAARTAAAEAALDRHYQSVQAARRAQQPSDIPHQQNRGRQL